MAGVFLVRGMLAACLLATLPVVAGPLHSTPDSSTIRHRSDEMAEKGRLDSRSTANSDSAHLTSPTIPQTEPTARRQPSPHSVSIDCGRSFPSRNLRTSSSYSSQCRYNLVSLILPMPHQTKSVPHAQNAQHLALRIMPQGWRFGLSPPNPIPQRHHTRIEISQRPQEQEHRRISRRVVSEFRHVRDADWWIPRCAGVDVDLVVAGAVVAAEGERFGESGD